MKACSPTCVTCTAATSTSCLTCSSSQFRTFQAGQCLCNTGYVDNGSPICVLVVQGQQVCSYTCTTCKSTSKSFCLTCSSLSFRILVVSSCLCIDGYYDDGLHQICQKCSTKCLTCSSATVCTSCSSAQNRQISNGNCLCLDGYFDNGGDSCQKCDIQCSTCDSLGCLKCPNPNYLRLNQPDSDHNCPCVSGTIQQDMNVQCRGIGYCGKYQFICQGDGILALGEDCDDGNLNDRDGCSSICKVELGFICRAKNNDSQCSRITNTNCLQVILNTDFTTRCILCQKNYYLSVYSSCEVCDVNCDGCTGPRSNQCKKCSSSAASVTLSSLSLLGSINCQICTRIPGLYITETLQCKSYCGDSIVRLDKGELCDDGNFVSNDGCSQDCQIEPHYTCVNQHGKHDQIYLIGPSVCTMDAALSAIFRYKNQYTQNQVELTFNHKLNQSDFCHRFNITTKSLADDQHNFVLQKQTNQTCLFLLNFQTSLPANQIITLQFNASITSNNGLKLQNDSFFLNSRQYTYYPPYQIEQSQFISKLQRDLNFVLLFLGILVIILGGVDFYLSILDLMTWVTTLYFINVNYPLNVKLFFQYVKWTDIFLLPSPLLLNQPTDDYYQQGPPKFDEKGVEACFLATLLQDIYFCVIGMLIYIVSKQICSLIEKIYIDTPQIIKSNESGFNPTSSIKTEPQQTQKSKIMPLLIARLYEYFSEIKKNKMAIIIKLLLLVYLDFQTASLLQIQAGQFFRHPFITANCILAFIVLAIGLYIPIFFYFITNKSALLLDHDTYEQKYGAVYEGLLIKDSEGKNYCILLTFQKTFFILFLIIFYDRPLFQSITCTLACFANIIMISFKNPFDDKTGFVRNLVPQIGILGSMATTIIYALDDQVQILDPDLKYKLGWVTLSFIFSSILILCIFLIQLLVNTLIERLQTLKECFFEKK